MTKLSQLILLLFVSCSCAITVHAAPNFTERTPAYFVDRYGYSKTSKNVKEISCLKVRHGSVKINGQYSVREFRSGELIIKATFDLPSLKLVSVWFQLPRQWTNEQIEAALTAYGSQWRSAHYSGIVKAWENPEGLNAISMLTFLEIQSPKIVRATNEVIREREAKKKAVPKF